MSANAKTFEKLNLAEWAISQTPKAERQHIKCNFGKDFGLVKSIARLQGLYQSKFEKSDTTIVGCTANLGPRGISRDPNDNTKFVNMLPDKISQEDFDMAVALFQAFDRMDEHGKDGLKKLKQKPSSWKNAVRTTQKAEGEEDNPMYVRACLKLQTYRDPAKPDGPGIKKPEGADSDYAVLFKRGKKKLTFEEAMAISKDALVAIEWTPSSIYKATSGQNIQHIVKRIEFLEDGTDPRKGDYDNEVTDDYLEDLEMPEAVKQRIKRQRVMQEEEDRAENPDEEDAIQGGEDGDSGEGDQ